MSFLEGIELSANLIDLFTRRLRNKNVPVDTQEDTTNNFDAQRKRATQRRDLTKEPILQDVMSLSVSKRIIYQVMLIVLKGGKP